jgi:hypothetical protein
VPSDTAEERTVRDVRSSQPINDRLPHPSWKTDVPRFGAFPLEANETPLPITLLNVRYLEFHKLSSPESRCEEHCQNRVIPLSPERIPINRGEGLVYLILPEPVSNLGSRDFFSPHTTNCRGFALAENPGVGRLLSKCPNRRKSQVHRCRRISSLGVLLSIAS